MWEYSEKVKEAFANPRNIGALEGANAIGEVGSLSCGDALKLYLKVNPETEIIEDATFETFGCASAIASSSALTEIIKGMPLSEAETITNKDIAKALDGLPKEKMHCSVMGEEALIAAARNYRGLPPEEHEEEGKIVCYCFNVEEETIRRAIVTNSLKTREDVTKFTKAGGACGSCNDAIEEILFEIEHGSSLQKPLSSFQRMQKVMDILQKEIVPTLPTTTDVEVIDIDDSTVRIKFAGETAKSKELKKTTMSKLTERLHEDLNMKVFEVLL
ncbi:MAG: Fe-S cluster assembly protein NifU [Desulfovibrionaceae bacterium]